MNRFLFRGFVICMIAGVLAVGTPGVQAQESAPVENNTAEPAASRGLTVEPGVIAIQNVVPGEKVDLYEKAGIALTVTNGSDRVRIFDIAPGLPSQMRLNVRDGYRDIPDPAWFKLEKESVRLAPFSKAVVKMYIDIPKDEKYYNQHFSVGLNIQSRPEAGEKIALGVKPIYYIETKSKEIKKVVPDGVLAVSPSLISIDASSLGKIKKAAAFTLLNNDSKKHRYTIACFVPPVERDHKITLSSGYAWIPDTAWIRPARTEVKIKPGKKILVNVDLDIPVEEAYRGKNHEGIVMIRSDDGMTNFVRILIDS